MWSRKRIEITWLQLACAALRCIVASRAQDSASKIALTLRQHDRSQHIIATQTLRSAFDLMLQALCLPPGSEVLVSAITIPDMVDILRYHGLEPVPVDFSPDTLVPTAAELERRRTNRTRAILIAHLFGARNNLDHIARFAEKNNLLLWEDAAQAFIPQPFLGSQSSDALLFSFGPTKPRTALGGGVIAVRDAKLASEIQKLQADYKTTSTLTYAKRIAKYAILKAVAARWVFGALRFTAGSRARLDSFLMSAVRNLPVQCQATYTGKLTSKMKVLRVRPCRTLLATVERQIRTALRNNEKRRIAFAHQLCDRLRSVDRGYSAKTSPFLPGQRSDFHAFWVMPIQVDSDPDRVVASLDAAGFDATRSSQLKVVGPAQDAPLAARLLEKVLFVPCYGEMNARAIQRLGNLIADGSVDPAVSKPLRGTVISVELTSVCRDLSSEDPS